jgi:phospholipid/cholesterol/gamma-HCH transport system permease protein
MPTEILTGPMPSAHSLHFTRPQPATLCVHLGGRWTTAGGLPELERVSAELPGVERLAFDSAALEAWDTLLLVFLARVQELGARESIAIDAAGLPDGVRRLLGLAAAVPERQDARRSAARAGWLARFGRHALAQLAGMREILAFVGETALACLRLAQGRARFRRADFLLVLQQCGAQALPIVSLISFLVGMILAYVGAVQLKQFGAQIFVANLVGLGMAREMGAMMTAIIMAGRTGAAFAAQLGTMTVGEEIDALRTSGFSPLEFLVLPRMLALVLMVPLLCLYADLMGILGGALVAVTSFDLGLAQYYDQTRAALSLHQFALGLLKAAVFGVLVALAGCLRGMQCGRSAAAVGDAATSAVVTGIVWIIVVDALMTVIYDVLGW